MPITTLTNKIINISHRPTSKVLNSGSFVALNNTLNSSSSTGSKNELESPKGVKKISVKLSHSMKYIKAL